MYCTQLAWCGMQLPARAGLAVLVVCTTCCSVIRHGEVGGCVESCKLCVGTFRIPIPMKVLAGNPDLTSDLDLSGDI